MSKRAEEKCKDSLQVHETCKENTNSLTSLEEAAWEYAYSWRKEGNKEVRELFPKAAYRAFIAGVTGIKRGEMVLLSHLPMGGQAKTILTKEGSRGCDNYIIRQDV